ncbi:MAG: valine--tRNA ligase [Desulfomonilaceae bacterium]|nr:valine--tRNA ligase [Desulfomonilaceae bacterium]
MTRESSNDSMDINQLPKHYDAKAAEDKYQALWSELGIFKYDPSKARDETFVVDTPPPTVSGSLHVGHVFSYTHTDIIVRYQRMLGKNIFYPMGWDDNGLPTERRVQNYFHVRCDPHAPFEKDPDLKQASSADRKKPPRIISRPNFIDLCIKLTMEDEKVFKDLWQRLGLSVDWSEEYSTIDGFCRTMAQLSFLDLFEKGHVYGTEGPTMWDVDFQTAIAQAEVEDREVDSAFHDIRFGVVDSDETHVISTTRPELLPACVGVAFHPDDQRYTHLRGKKALTPLFHTEVQLFPSTLVEPDKGTGILMVCTFGDQTDVQWWREEHLPLKQIILQDGRLARIVFGTNGWESRNPDLANGFYSQLAGKTLKQARAAIVEMLKTGEGAAGGNEAPLVGSPKPIRHAVKFFEKGDKPLEFIITRQWFVRLLDKKDQLLRKGEEIKWFPRFMHSRYRDWTQNLNIDWCISRQRFFGVPFPVWYRLDGEGRPDYENPLTASREELPVDPSTSPPAGFREEQRDRPNGFMAEPDVFDTWFTSSLTPQIGSHWVLDRDRHRRLFPMDVRPQSHEIIRTWGFYTIAKALLHEDEIPWKNINISGWVLDPDRKKMSKSKGNVVVPTELLETFSSDALRYWSGNARLGVDTAYDENIVKIGKRLVVKIYNASKFVLSQSGDVSDVSCEMDRAFVDRLRKVVLTATEHLNEFNFSGALSAVESFFWNSFTDTYVEFSKVRAWGGQGVEAKDQGSALATLRMGLETLIKMFAPFVPYICEEVWSWRFAKETGIRSVCIAPWPKVEDFDAIPLPDSPRSFDVAVAAYSAVNRAKSDSRLSRGAYIERLALSAAPKTLNIIETIADDVKGAARCHAWELIPKEGLEEDVVEVGDVHAAERD